MKLYTFSKKEHLCKQNEFKQLSLQGKSIYCFPFRCVYVLRKAEKFQTKIGISVSKKNIKLAVDRNYIKRLIRETYRLNKPILYSFYEKEPLELWILLIYTDKNLPTFSSINSSVNTLLNKIIKIDFKNQQKITNNNE
jgi:ribonuclease P protein component